MSFGKWVATCYSRGRVSFECNLIKPTWYLKTY